MGYRKRLIYEKENQLIYDVKIVRRFDILVRSVFDLKYSTNFVLLWAKSAAI